jgi:hypothetical protein
VNQPLERAGRGGPPARRPESVHVGKKEATHA